MKYLQIIAQAWQLTVENKKLIWFAFVPSFVGVLVFMLEIGWQYFLLSEEFGTVQSGYLLQKIGDFFRLLTENNLLGLGIFLLIFGVLFYFLFPAWIQSTLILGVRHRFNDATSPFSLRQKIIDGFEYFVPLFEVRAILAPFEFTTIALFTTTLYRYYHGDIFDFLFPIIIGYAVASLFVGLLFTFAPFFVVLQKQSFTRSIKRSVGLVFLHIGNTVGLYLLMLLINIRVIVNVVVIFGVPALIFAIATYFSDSDWLGTFLILGGMIGVVLVALAAYLTAILEVFSVAFWERAFVGFLEQQKQLSQETSADE